MQPDLLHALNRARANRQAVATLTDLDGGTTRLLWEGEAVEEPVAGLLEKAFRTGRAALVEIGHRQHFLNVYLPPVRIVVIGAVHISQALAPMAEIAGFDLVVIDPRTAFATPERFAGVELIAEWPEDALRQHPLDPHTALVAVTHDPKIDDVPLVSALVTGCFYVGALGSRKTHARRVERLKAEGIGDADIARISAPIGLDIGAATPAEIAVSVLADIIRAYRCRDLRSGEAS
nr:XdhC family protein [uncultured Gellertiella sp.]